MCPAVSKSQQRLMGMVHAYEKGDLEISKLPKALQDKIKSISKSMTDKDATEFASTKHKGLPEEVPENAGVNELFDKIVPGARRASDEEYKIALTFANKNNLKLNSVGADKKTGNINVRATKKGMAKNYDFVLNPKGKKIKGSIGENTLTDTPPYAEYGYTRDGVVQCTASRNTCLTRMKTDRQRNPGSKFQMIYSPDLVEGEIFEGINEIKSDKDMVKDGLKYAKKKYKYDAKGMKELAADTLQYIKSGEIDDQGSMEAYIDFRNDEMTLGEIKETIRGVVKEVITEDVAETEKYKLWNTSTKANGIMYVNLDEYGQILKFNVRPPDGDSFSIMVDKHDKATMNGDPTKFLHSLCTAWVNGGGIKSK